MNIQEFCGRDVVTIDVGDSALTAAQRMRDRHVGALVVTRTAGTVSATREEGVRRVLVASASPPPGNP